jgi:hypothetical protein
LISKSFFSKIPVLDDMGFTRTSAAGARYTEEGGSSIGDYNVVKFCV